MSSWLLNHCILISNLEFRYSNFLPFKFYLLLFYLLVLACMYCSSDIGRDKERASDSLELEMQMVVSHHVGALNHT